MTAAADERTDVTILCDISSFYSETGGGVKTYHEQKMRYFAAHKAHTYIMVVPSNTNGVEETEYGKQYRVRGFKVSRDGAYRQMIDYPFLSRIMRTERPDVLELGSCYLDSWLARISGASTVPVVTGFYHADFPDSYILPALKGMPSLLSRPVVEFWRRYVAFAYRRLDATIVASGYMSEKLSTFGVQNCREVPLGVDTEVFHPSKRDLESRRRLGIGDGETLLLFAGRFSSEKGTETLVNALPSLLRRPDVRIVFVGSGPLRPFIVSVAAAHDAVQVLDFIHDRERLAALYASADVFLSPGPYETFGLSTLEAMSSGAPVVAPDSGGAGELVSKCRGGVLFDSGDPDALAGAVDTLLETNYRRIGLQGRSYVAQRFSWDHTFSRLLAVYEAILTSKSERQNAS